MDDIKIFQKIQECLAGALGIEAEAVRPESSLVKDLGAESIDFIDIIFRLERSFEIKIPSGELFPANLLNEERLVQNGVLTADGLAAIREKMPYLDLAEFEKDPQVSRLADFFTVQMILSYIRERLTAKDPRSS